MNRRGWGLLCALFVTGVAAAQSPGNEYYPYAAESEEYAPVQLTDSAIFYRAIQSVEDVFAEKTDYNLSFVATKRRGEKYSSRPLSLHGVALPSRYATALRSLGLGEYRYAGLSMTPEQSGSSNGVHEFLFPAEEPSPFRYAAVNFTDRNYLAGVKCTFAERFGRNWSLVASANARTGRDLHIEGVFTNSASLNFRVAKHFGEDHDLSLLLVIPPSMRGVRSSTTEEAFTLVGDRFYNPSWGLQDNKVRSANIRREFVPLAMALYRLRLSHATLLAVSFGAEVGVQKYSALGWYNARTPMPDNYRNMPSYSGDREVEAAWRANNTRYTQINWDELYEENRMADGHAVYALEDRVERLCNLHFNAAFSTDFDSRLSLHYGLLFRRTDSRNYKQMRDLMGAQYITDIDQYLVDDDTYDNKLQNDLRNPDRMIRRGDRFGYDYNMTGTELGVRVLMQYHSDRFRSDVGAEIVSASLFRRGNYEKELFAGARSFGKSRKLGFTPYVLKGLVGWSFSPRSYLEATLMAGAELPDAEDLFLQPQYNNRVVDNPVLRRVYAAELNYNLTGRAFSLRLSAFVNSSSKETETRRYYDDLAARSSYLSSAFCDMAVANIGRLSYGLEAAADLRISYRWSLSLAVTAGRYKFLGNPQVTVLSDVDNTAVDMHAVSYMDGCTTGGTPQVAGTAGVAYFGAKGWGFRAAANYAGSRYVEPMPLRRTERIARQASLSREQFDAFTVQERLNDAFTLDASAFKSFYFEQSRLTVSLMLKNLLNNRNTFYNGYESLRVHVQRNGGGSPHATRYTSAYPFSFYLSVSYKY